MKSHYFDQDASDPDDWQLAAAKGQGYVPNTCLLGGPTVMSYIYLDTSPCLGCNGPREKCKGQSKIGDPT